MFFHSLYSCKTSVRQRQHLKGNILTKVKLDVTKYGSRVLSSNFVNEISKVLHWQFNRGTSKANVEECNFKDDLTSKTIRSDNLNKLIFAHLNINLNF